MTQRWITGLRFSKEVYDGDEQSEAEHLLEFFTAGNNETRG
jgi:hypothetical protein